MGTGLFRPWDIETVLDQGSQTLRTMGSNVLIETKVRSDAGESCVKFNEVDVVSQTAMILEPDQTKSGLVKAGIVDNGLLGDLVIEDMGWPSTGIICRCTGSTTVEVNPSATMA